MTRDYFAEMYVAGVLADNGWNVYFPRRDKGFDFVIAKEVAGHVALRPVQVKGKYPSHSKTDKSYYGYIGRLSLLHPDMVLAIPYFSTDETGVAPVCVAYLPRSLVRQQISKGYKCQPAKFQNGQAVPRPDYAKYFDRQGVRLMELPSWK
jgi:hypothetical protein